MAQKLGITNFDTMNKRCLCHTMALLWRKNDIIQVQLPETPADTVKHTGKRPDTRDEYLKSVTIALPETPDEYTDPITRVPLDDPVLTDYGFTYNSSTIDQLPFHDGETNKREPTNRLPLTRTTPNRIMKTIVDQWKVSSGYYDEDVFTLADVPIVVNDDIWLNDWIRDTQRRLSTTIVVPTRTPTVMVQPRQNNVHNTPIRTPPAPHPILRNSVNIIIVMSDHWIVNEEYSRDSSGWICVKQYANGLLHIIKSFPLDTIFNDLLFVENDFNDNVRFDENILITRRQTWEAACRDVFPPNDFRIEFSGSGSSVSNTFEQRPFASVSSFERPTNVPIGPDMQSNGQQWRRRRYIDIVTLLSDNNTQRERFIWDMESQIINTELYIGSDRKYIGHAPMFGVHLRNSMRAVHSYSTVDAPYDPEINRWFDTNGYNRYLTDIIDHTPLRALIIADFQSPSAIHDLSSDRCTYTLNQRLSSIRNHSQWTWHNGHWMGVDRDSNRFEIG